jgi:hypothetical protein
MHGTIGGTTPRLNLPSYLLDCVVGVVFYIDTVGIRTAHWWTPDEIKFLRQKSLKMPRFRVSKISFDGKRYWTKLFQPNDAALHMVSAHAHSTSHFEPAMDILVHDSNEAQLFGEYFREHSIQRWQGKRAVITHENNRYSARAFTPAGYYRRGVNRSDYHDKPSKVTSSSIP